MQNKRYINKSHSSNSVHGGKEETKKPSGIKPAFESEEEMNLPALWSRKSFGIEKISHFLSVCCMKKKNIPEKKAGINCT